MTKKLYPVNSLLKEDDKECTYIGTDGLYHRVECYRVHVYRE